MTDKVSKLNLIAAFAAVYFFWGSTFLAIRFAVEAIPPFFMAGVRFAIAGGILYAWARFKGAALPTLRQWIPAFVIGTLLLVCGNGGVVLAERTVPSGLVSLMVAMVPVYFALMEWCRPGGSAPGLRVSIGLLVGVMGLLLLVGPANIFGGSSNIDLKGVAFVTVGSLCWSFGSLYSRTVKIAEHPAMGVAMQTLAAGLVLLLISILTNESKQLDITAISSKAILSVAYLIVFGSIIGFSAYIWLLQNVKSTMVATYAYVNPVVAVFLGWIIAGETVSAQTAIAASVILVAVWLITQAKPKPAPQAVLQTEHQELEASRK
ncbi:MAG: EamA family transporter [Candidatus Obscuribacterales bacterium]|nr:EamA family transporter [Candidatus Obscuribacterales bacterium]